jgi:hypothetical protein
MKKILLLFLLYIGIWQQMHAQQFISGNLVYVITSQTTVKLGAQNPNLVGNITIPASVVYNNQPYIVTNIGDYSFSLCAEIDFILVKSVNISQFDPSSSFFFHSRRFVQKPNKLDRNKNGAYVHAAAKTSI